MTLEVTLVYVFVPRIHFSGPRGGGGVKVKNVFPYPKCVVKGD